jgi:hypothetical protein
MCNAKVPFNEFSPLKAQALQYLTGNVTRAALKIGALQPVLFVSDISSTQPPTHVCLLNKFNVIDNHLLIVTWRYHTASNHTFPD